MWKLLRSRRAYCNASRKLRDIKSWHGRTPQIPNDDNHQLRILQRLFMISKMTVNISNNNRRLALGNLLNAPSQYNLFKFLIEISFELQIYNQVTEIYCFLFLVLSSFFEHGLRM